MAKSFGLFACLTILSLAGFTVFGDSLVDNTTLLSLLVIGLLISSSGVIALLSPYTAEVYPSRIRSTGAGWAAACSKGAGVATISLAVVSLIPGIAVSAALAAVPTALAAALIASKGLETRGRTLEEIAKDQMQSVGS